MILRHHHLVVELPDLWWEEAKMQSFRPSGISYRADAACSYGIEIVDIPIADIGPVARSPGVSIFSDNAEATARQRVISILTGFRTSSKIAPVKVISEETDNRFRYRLADGAHRLYCSLAAGYSHVPTITVRGWE